MAEKERQEQSKCLNMFAGRRGRQKQVGDGRVWSCCCVMCRLGSAGAGSASTSQVARRKSPATSRPSQGVLVGSRRSQRGRGDLVRLTWCSTGTVETK
jgi:hypothetical protein